MSLEPAALPVIRKSSAPLRRQVLEELRRAIITGRLAPGARLVERELIAMLGVSRTVIREALRQLESEGLIVANANRGLAVRELTLTEAKDLYTIRAVLEGLAARLFVENADSGQVERLREALEATIEAYRNGEPEQVLEAKNEFYDVLFEGAASETLSTMIATLHARVSRWRALGLGHPRRSEQRSKESVTVLRSLLTAIEDRDPDRAEAIARKDVTKAAAEVVKLLGESKQGKD
jgi:DNA-binding GntR family transcriptional regulator